MMLSTQSCSKCGGRLRVDGDQYGSFLQCYRCGLIVDPPKAVVADVPQVTASASGRPIATVLQFPVQQPEVVSAEAAVESEDEEAIAEEAEAEVAAEAELDVVSGPTLALAEEPTAEELAQAEAELLEDALDVDEVEAEAEVDERFLWSEAA